MDFNNDIGSFGLPLIDDDNTKSSHRGSGAKKSSKKKLKKLQTNNNFMVHHHTKSTATATTTNTNTNGKMIKKKRKRLQKQQTNSTREEELGNSSSDDESLALSQLAVATNSKKKCSIANNNTANGIINSNKVHKKDKKQVGLHSFLVKSANTDINASTTTSTSTIATINTTIANNNNDKKRPHSFVAPSLDVDYTNDDDIIDYFSDNDEELANSNDIPSNKVQTRLDADIVSSNDQEDDIIAKELKHKQQMKLQKKLDNRIQFGITNTILGHNLPTRYGSSSNKNKTNILSTLTQRTYLGGNKSILNNIQLYSRKQYNVSNTVNLSSTSSSTNNHNNNNIGEVTSMSFDKDGILLATGDDKGNIRIYDFDDVYSLDVTKRNEINKLYLKSQDYEEQEVTDVSDEIGNGRDSNEGEEDSRRESDETDNAPRRVSDENSGNSSDEQSQQKQQHTIIPSLANPILSFQCKTWLASRQGRNRPRISSVKWCPENQDHLLVSFA